MVAADEFRLGLGVSTINGFERAAIRQDVYDQVFLKESDHPYSTIRMSNKERYSSTHLWYSRMAEFMLYNAAEKTGLSFVEFVKMPTWFVENTLSTLRQQSKDTRQGAASLQKDIEKMGDAAVENFSNMKKR
jgi:hypothetical protein